jgi:hypothetical protein
MARNSKTVVTSIAVFVILINVFFVPSLFAGSLVAYWSFDEGSGDVLKDCSGTGNNGKIYGNPKWVDSNFGKAMEFDGYTFIVVPNNDSYNFKKDDSFTIALWINYQPKGDWAGPLQKFNGWYPFKVEIDTANVLYFAVYDGTNFPRADIGDIHSEWHQCCFVRDAINKKLIAYLDGELKQESVDTTTDEIANTDDLYIGARTPGDTITYKGMLDEIAIYNRILTEDEIKQAANGWLPEVITIVAIDINPGSYPNSINLGSRGVIPVAILSTKDFDATKVDPLSVKFGPAGATEVHKKGHIEDVDKDGDLDMVLHFNTQDTGIKAGDTEVSLTGKTIDGKSIKGIDAIVTVPSKGKPAPAKQHMVDSHGKLSTFWGKIREE